MKIEQTAPAKELGKRFIELDPLTAKGFDALKKLDEALRVFNEWLKETWEGDREKELDFATRFLSLSDWCRDEVFILAKDIYDISGGERI